MTLGYFGGSMVPTTVPVHSDTLVDPSMQHTARGVRVMFSLFVLKQILIFLQQSWIQPYAETWDMNYFAWMAHTYKHSYPVDGATLVLMSLLLKRNISVVSYSDDCPVWHANNEVEPDIMLVYLGESRFIEAEVGTYIFTTLLYNYVVIYYILKIVDLSQRSLDGNILVINVPC